MAYHPFSETESKAPAELAVCIVFLILTYLSVGARCYVRIYIIKSFGWDDALMVVALMFFNVWAISIIIIAYEYGGGTRVDVIGTAMDWILVSEIFYVITAMTVKLSLGIFFLRIVIKPWQRAMVYVVMVLIALTSIFFFFFLIFLCGNPKDYLIRYVYDQCAPRHVQTALAYLSAALGAAADWTYALIPVQIVVQANMDLRSKLSVLFILSLGTAGCVCSTVRLKYIEGLVSPTDFFWNAATIAIWSGIECGAGITAGSLATLRPLFKRWFATVRSLASGSLNSSGRRNRRNKANPDGGAESSSGAGAGGSSSSGGRGNRGGAGKPNTSSQRSFASKSLPSKSSSSGQASDNNSSNNTTGRPLTAWPASGCWEKLDERDHSIERRPASSSSSLDLICATRTAAPSEDLELSTLSRETSADTAYHHHQQQLVEQPYPRSPSLPPPPLPTPHPHAAHNPARRHPPPLRHRRAR
ncbi:hypothetical protein MPH_10401 [Macrophomina phaseolina MS6]|uniref:Rhodopsin domain-containing protein n=1 Tax=Macrophomina phaseolina (strain MS6) TaxID=1126212 RepID=K2S6J0_MACPH|nr:hypothetical protein MPH_10401 [Macrophomina phaseolina MS6]